MHFGGSIGHNMKTANVGSKDLNSPAIGNVEEEFNWRTDYPHVVCKSLLNMDLFLVAIRLDEMIIDKLCTQIFELKCVTL